MRDIKVIGVQIPANEALSGVVDLGTHEFIAIEMPEAWAGTTITFQSKAKATQNGTNQIVEDWDNVYDSAGNEISMTVAANRVVVPTAAHAAALAPLRYLRIRSGTSSAAVNQNPAREIRLIVK